MLRRIPPVLRAAAPRGRVYAEWHLRGTPLRVKGVEHAGDVAAFGSRVSYDSYRLIRYLVGEVFLEGTYDVGELPRAPTIVDCGANIGVTTWFFQWRYPGSFVMAIEPAPRSFELLAMNIRNNAWACTAFNEAVADSDGSIALHLKPDQTTTPSASTVPGRVVGETEAVTVAARRLSARLPDHVDLLKLDVEGSETSVLKELEESGSLDRVDRIVAEYHLHVPGSEDGLPVFLQRLSENGFCYSLTARGSRSSPSDFQDIMVYASRV